MNEQAENDYLALKKDLMEKNTLITRPIGRLDVSVTRGKKSNKRFTPVTMKNGINRYFSFCEQHDELPSIKGLCIYMKIYKDQFYKYLQYPEFTDIMEQAKLHISNWAEQDVYLTKGMAAGKISYMKNIHGWTEKTEQTSTIMKIDLTPEQARAKIELLAPRLLELLKSDIVVNQLTGKQPQVLEAETA